MTSDTGIVFRKRALPKGGAISHVLGHDEVYTS
jgi:hypothetical protein